MNSPFPGMDPYIEACGLWADFHNHFIEKIYERIAETVPERYLVRTGERSYVVLVESEAKEQHAFIPDVGITSTASDSATGPATAVAEPVTEVGTFNMRAFIDEHFREKFVEIFETEPEQRLVTCIEVLSPANKRRGSEGWGLYLRKRQALMLGAANLVEIDLLRGGHKMPMLDPWPAAPYTFLVCRRSRSPYCQVKAAHFQTPVPAIGVPLADPDPDVSLALQPMIEAIYARARYFRSIDYSLGLSPALAGNEQSWLAEQLHRRTLTA